jgi:tRNA threonylcarbamoyladenosine biosynthesis protein TsaB
VSSTDALLLALDGSTQTCSAALLRVEGGVSGCPGAGYARGARRRRTEYQAGENGRVIAARRSSLEDRAQAKVLLRLADEMLKEVGSEPKDLVALVVGTGPGTFTGVRIAVATARALALALSVPVFGVSTLAALAAGAAVRVAAREERALPVVVPVVDARRQQVFYGVYEPEDPAAGRPGRWRRRGEFAVCGRDDLGACVRERVVGHIVVVGELPEVLEGRPCVGAEFVAAKVEAEHLVLGQDLIGELCALRRGLRRGDAGTPEDVRPIYVRSPDADVHITKMKDPWAEGRSRTRGKG